MGTYSYAIAPEIKDRVRSVGFVLTPAGSTTIAAAAPGAQELWRAHDDDSTIPVAGIRGASDHEGHRQPHESLIRSPATCVSR